MSSLELDLVQKVIKDCTDLINSGKMIVVCRILSRINIQEARRRYPGQWDPVHPMIFHTPGSPVVGRVTGVVSTIAMRPLMVCLVTS